MSGRSGLAVGGRRRCPPVRVDRSAAPAVTASCSSGLPCRPAPAGVRPEETGGDRRVEASETTGWDAVPAADGGEGRRVRRRRRSRRCRRRSRCRARGRAPREAPSCHSRGRSGPVPCQACLPRCSPAHHRKPRPPGAGGSGEDAQAPLPEGVRGVGRPGAVAGPVPSGGSGRGGAIQVFFSSALICSARCLE